MLPTLEKLRCSLSAFLPTLEKLRRSFSALRPPQLFASSQNSISFAFRDCCAARFTTLQRPRLQLPLKGSAAASAACWLPQLPASLKTAGQLPKLCFTACRNCCETHFTTLFKGPAAASLERLRCSFRGLLALTTPRQPQNFCPAPKTLFLWHVETAAKHVSPPFKALLQLPLKGSAAASAACWLPQLRASLKTAGQLPKPRFYNHTLQVATAAKHISPLFKQLPLKGSAAASAACSHNSVPASKLLASSQNSFFSIAFRNCYFATLHKGPPQLRASFKTAGQLPKFCFYSYTACISKLYVSPSFKRLAAASAGSHNPCQPQSSWPAPRTLLL